MIVAEFSRLSNLIAALPLTTDEYWDFAINWIAGARECWTPWERLSHPRAVASLRCRIA